MEKYIFNTSIEALKKYLDDVPNDAEKLELLNLNLTQTKRMIKELKSTKVAEGYGNGAYDLYTENDLLVNLFVEEVEHLKTHFHFNATEIEVKEIIENLIDRLKKYQVFLKTEYIFIKRKSDYQKVNIEEGGLTEKKSQRQMIIQYCKDNHCNLFGGNLKNTASKITDYLYPSLDASKKKHKVNSIRQELMVIRKNNQFE